MPLLYRGAVLLVAMFMVLLPLVYVALIIAAGYLVYLHAVNDVWILSGARGRGAIVVLIVYLAPLVIGPILIAFMIKPLFAREATNQRPRSLRPQDEPLLFAFVERICRAVGAPTPKRIDVDCQVNASAGFRRGWWSVLFGGDLVLTIGLPLAAGFTTRQFAGVLAHEFGHFSQRVGMRFSYVIRSVSNWFARVVYQRDQWDETLDNWARQADLRIGIVLHAARFCVWLTRRVLWVLMYIGHAASVFLLRQMEFHADLYETRLGGSASFEASTLRLRVLSVAWQKTQNDLQSYYREGRLGDDVSRLVAANAAQMPDDLRRMIESSVSESKTGFFDTHPCDRQRIAAAQRENAPGLFQVEAEATRLFTDFAALSRTCTFDYYKACLGAEFSIKSLRPTDELLAHQEKQQALDQCLERYFLGCFTSLRPHPAPSPETDAPASGRLAARIRESRDRLLALQPGYQNWLTEYRAVDRRRADSAAAAGLFSAGQKLTASDFSVAMADRDAIYRVGRQAAQSLTQLAGAMDPFESTAGQRLAAALALCDVVGDDGQPLVPNAPALRPQRDRLLTAWRYVERMHGQLMQLRDEHAALGALLSRVTDGNNVPDGLAREIVQRSGKLFEKLLAFHQDSIATEYPFDHAKGRVSMADYLLPHLPDPENVVGAFHAADSILDTLPPMYARIVAALCEMAETAEASLGLAPLEAPPAPKPPEQGAPAA